MVAPPPAGNCIHVWRQLLMTRSSQQNCQLRSAFICCFSFVSMRGTCVPVCRPPNGEVVLPQTRVGVVGRDIIVVSAEETGLALIRHLLRKGPWYGCPANCGSPIRNAATRFQCAIICMSQDI